MDREEIKQMLFNLPEVAAWPDLAAPLTQALGHPRHDWELPLIACRAVGGDNLVIAPAATALVCVQLSIALVDDMLDQDPRGLHPRIGEGATANVGLALQAIAFRLVENIPVEAEYRAAVTASLAQMALATAFGQSLDVQNLQGEENYWKIVRAKSTPFYGAALHIGALLGKTSPEVAGRLRQFGILNGEIIQIYDDLADALQKPANPDWKQGRNNLAILYALTADYSERERFRALLPQIDDPEALQEAQRILIRGGAASYCAYHIVKRYQAARQLIDGTPLADPTPLRDLLGHQIEPLLILLRGVGAVIPPELETV